MAGIIICLMHIFAYGIKTDLGHDFNSALAKYLMSLNFSMALAFISAAPCSRTLGGTGWQAVSRPSAAGGGGRRPAFTGLATQPYSTTEVDG